MSATRNAPNVPDVLAPDMLLWACPEGVTGKHASGGDASGRLDDDPFPGSCQRVPYGPECGDASELELADPLREVGGGVRDEKPLGRVRTYPEE